MKLSNKILSFLLALLLFVTALTACEPQTDLDGIDSTVSSNESSEGDSSEQGIDSSVESADTESNGESEDATDPNKDESVSSEQVSDSSVESTDTEQKPEDETDSTEDERVGSVTILNGSEITIEVGKSVRLTIYTSPFITQNVGWAADAGNVYVDERGYVTALEVGDVTVTAFAGKAADSILIHVIAKTEDTSEPLETEPNETESSTDSDELEFGDGNLETLPRDEIIEAVNSPSGYLPAGSYEEAIERSKQNKLSGYDFVPDQAPILSEYRPMQNGKYVKNNNSYYIDYNTYVVIDVYGREVFRIYRGGAYITLEEIAAYVYAFGTYPANHTAKKTTSVSGNAWGKYLRSNHTHFSGNTSQYPYEPELPRISGCGGDLQYWEMDIGTTGTDCDPSYRPTIYNNGSKINRGAARLVYTWNDLNDNGLTDSTDIVFVFYTYNHYNDFQEYLNYYGGWGEMFGNVTGGGKISSKTDYNPTPYVPVVSASLTDESLCANNTFIYAWVDKRAFELVIAA